jgi:hypothetical protein
MMIQSGWAIGDEKKMDQLPTNQSMRFHRNMDQNKTKTNINHLSEPVLLLCTNMTDMTPSFFLQIFLSTLDAGYNYSCQEVKYTNDPKETRVGHVCTKSSQILWQYTGFLSPMMHFILAHLSVVLKGTSLHKHYRFSSLMGQFHVQWRITNYCIYVKCPSKPMIRN